MPQSVQKLTLFRRNVAEIFQPSLLLKCGLFWAIMWLDGSLFRVATSTIGRFKPMSLCHQAV